MATPRYYYRKDGRVESGKWRARVKQDWTEYFLGEYTTREEAERVEGEFRAGNTR